MIEKKSVTRISKKKLVNSPEKTLISRFRNIVNGIPKRCEALAI